MRSRIESSFSSRVLFTQIALRWHFVGRGQIHRLPAPLIVSLTSYPIRYPTLALTLKCLLRQTIRADRTILWIAHDDFASLPQEILDLQRHGLEIRATEDKRSYKKILPALDTFPDAYICTADDDVYYFPTWLEELASSINSDNRLIPCHRAHSIIPDSDDGYAPYAQWKFNVATRGEAHDLFPTGVGGILYPPSILNHTPEDRKAAFDLCPYADDVWLYWIGRRNGARYETIGTYREHIMWGGSQTQCLYQENVIGGRNDEQIHKIAEKYGYPNLSNEAPKADQA